MRTIVTDRIAWSVGLSVGLAVGRSDTAVSPAKMDEPIKVPFGLRTRLGPRNHLLDRGPDTAWEGQFFEERGYPLESIGTACDELCKNG